MSLGGISFHTASNLPIFNIDGEKMSLSNRYQEFIQTAATPAILHRSVKVAVIVGTILMLINHGDAIFAGNIDIVRVSKIMLTYLVPFCVSTQASVSATLATKKSQGAQC